MDIPLREYFDQRVTSLEEKLEVQFNMQNIALDKAEDKMNERLEGMNEFRAALKDQAATFITREEMNLKFQAENKCRRDNIAMAVSLVAFCITILKLFI